MAQKGISIADLRAAAQRLAAKKLAEAPVQSPAQASTIAQAVAQVKPEPEGIEIATKEATTEAKTQEPTPEQREKDSYLVDACKKGDLESVKQALGAGADVNAKDELYGRTATIWAVITSNIEIVNLLLSQGADPSLKDKDGRTASTFAIRNMAMRAALERPTAQLASELVTRHYSHDQTRVIGMQKPTEAEKPSVSAPGSGSEENAPLPISRNVTSIERGMVSAEIENALAAAAREALIREQLKQLNDELLNAVDKGDVELFKQALAKGASLSARDENFNTLLMFAAFHNDVGIGRLLLEKHAYVDAKNNVGWTALMWACDKGNEEFVDLLLSEKPKLDITDANGDTAYSLACVHGYTSIVAKLEAAAKSLEAPAAEPARKPEERQPIAAQAAAAAMAAWAKPVTSPVQAPAASETPAQTTEKEPERAPEPAAGLNESDAKIAALEKELGVYRDALDKLSAKFVETANQLIAKCNELEDRVVKLETSQSNDGKWIA